MVIHESIRRFLRTRDGSATVEFTMLVPAFLGFILFAADTATSYTRQSNLWSVSQQTARIVSRHGMDAEAGARFAEDHLRVGDYTPDVVVMINEAEQLVTVRVTADSSVLAPFGILSRSLSDSITVTVSQALEPI
jgi:Flp pilus assembly protein TadG